MRFKRKHINQQSFDESFLKITFKVRIAHFFASQRSFRERTRLHREPAKITLAQAPYF